MQTIVKNVRYYCLLLGLSFGFECRIVNGGIYTVPLELQTETSSFGEYRAASFDFGFQWSRIESISLDFVMPQGYQGTAVATGHSFHSRELYFSLHETENSIGIGELNIIPTALGVSTFNIRANEPSQINFRQHQILSWPGEPVTEPVWPAFLTRGSGRVAIVDLSLTSYISYFSVDIGGHSYSWSDPGPLESAHLTVIGTPVPEPRTAVWLLVYLPLFILVRKTRRVLPLSIGV